MNSKEFFNVFSTLAIPGGLESLMNSSGRAKEDPEYKMGNGYELRPIELFDDEGNVKQNREKYSHLYHNGLKISDKVFRRGGLNGDFKDGYAVLILYVEDAKSTSGFDFGTHVIINNLGDVVLFGSSSLSYPSHPGGNIGRMDDTFYNLLTGEEIMHASSSNYIESKNFLIVQHKYNWSNKSLPLGLYSINKITCEVRKIDDI